MKNATHTVVPTLVACFLATGAPLPTLRRGNGTDVLRAAQQVLGAMHQQTSHRRCSFFFVMDDDSPTTRLDEVLGSEGLGSDGMAVFKVVENRGSAANLTQTLLSRVVANARRLRLLSWCVTIVVVSDDPVFLAAFAEASDSGRLLVWETRLLVVTRLAMPRLRNLLQGYWTFSMMNTMFLTSKPEIGNERCQLYVNMPYSPSGAQVVRIVSWTTDHGLVQVEKYPYFPEKYRNFHGMGINVAWTSFQPYFMEMTDSDYKSNEVSRYTGRDYEILEVIARALNFSINFLPLGRMDQVMKFLTHRQVYIRSIKVAIMPHLLESIDFTMFIEQSTMTFSMAKPNIKPSWQSLYYPLQPGVWSSIVASVLLVFTALMLMNHGPGNEDPEAWLVVKQVVGILLDEAIPGELPRRSTTRLVLAAWLIFAFIMGTLYRSNLTASLTAPKYPPRAETLAELIHTEAKITTNPGVLDFIKSFKQSSSKLYRAISDRTEFVPTTEVGLQQAIDDKKAHVYERLNMKVTIAEHFTRKDGSTSFYVARENIVPDYGGWPLTPNAPFKANLDHCIMAFQGAGLIDKWTRDILARVQFNSQRRQNKAAEASTAIADEQDAAGVNSDTKALTLVHMQGPLFLYLAGAFLSLAVFFGETTISHCHLRHRINEARRPVSYSPNLLH